MTRRPPLAAAAVAALVVAAGVARADPPPPLGPAAGYAVSWVGNTWGEPSGQAVQNYVADIWVAPDGTVYTDSTWDENHYATGIYRDGRLVGRLQPDDGPDNSGGQAGRAVVGDGTHVFAAFTTGAALRRFHPDGTLAPFPGGAGQGNGVPVPPRATVDGLAVDPANHRLFAAVAGRVRVYDTANLAAEPSSFAVPAAGKMAAAADGTVWVASAPPGRPARVLHFKSDGTPLPDTIGGGERFDPAALCVHDGALYVADNGPDQQVMIYKHPTGERTSPDATFGVKGGLYAAADGVAAGTPGERRFRGLGGVGVDNAGNIYLGQSTLGPRFNFQHQGTHLESYQLADGHRNWDLLGLEFVDGGAFDADGQTATTVDLYTKFNRYTLDLNRHEPGSEWRWVGQTVDPFAHPADYRAAYTDFLNNQPTAARVRTIAGRKFLFCSTMSATNLTGYRFAGPGTVATPSVTVTDDHLWRDANGNGRPDPGETADGPGPPSRNGITGYDVDPAGDLWQTYPNGHGPPGVRHFACRGLDPAGNPVWDYAHVRHDDQPAPMTELYRSVYVPKSDALFLAGYATGLDPDHHYNGRDFNPKTIGSVLARYDGWAAGRRAAKWAIVLPDYNRGPSSLAVAGDFAFVAYDGLAYEPDDGFVYIFRTADGGYVGKLQNRRPTWNGRVDIEYGCDAVARPDGEYLVSVENDYHAAVTLYRWRPARTAPRVPAVVATAGNTVVDLRWPADPAAGSYRVRRAAAAGGPFVTVADRLAEPRFADVGRPDGVACHYQVVACGPRGDTPSAAVSATPGGDRPLRINVGGGSVEPGLDRRHLRVRRADRGRAGRGRRTAVGPGRRAGVLPPVGVAADLRRARAAAGGRVHRPATHERELLPRGRPAGVRRVGQRPGCGNGHRPVRYGWLWPGRRH